MPVQRKKAGCHNYANVNDNYMLYNAAVATPKVGGRKGGRSYRGGNEGTPNGLEASANAILGLSSGVINTVNQGISQLTGKEGFYNSPYYENPGTPTSANNHQGQPVPTNPPTGTPVQAPQDPQQAAMKGGRPRGGCPTCNSKTKGGAVELAPFAASLAFLAARMSMDDKLNFTNLFRSMGSQQEPETPVARRSSARRSTARA
jgi:hypothetical protein